MTAAGEASRRRVSGADSAVVPESPPPPGAEPGPAWAPISVETAAGRYRGPDRRQASVRPPDVLVRRYRILALVVALLVGGLAVAVAAFTDADRVVLRASLSAVVATVAIIAGSVGIVRGRFLGEASVRHLGVGLLIYGAVAGILGGIGLALDPDTATASAYLMYRVIGVAVAFVFAAWAVLSQPVDSGLATQRLVGVATLMAGILMFSLTVLVVAIPPVRDLVLEGDLGGSPLLAVAMAAGLVVVVVQRSRQPSNSDTVGVPFMMALLFGELVLLAPSAAVQSVRPLLGSTAGLYACTLALMQWVADIRDQFVRKGADMWAAQVQHDLGELDHAEKEARRRSEAHDVRSTVLAARFATAALRRDTGQLTPERRVALAEALDSEIARLGHMVDAAPEVRPTNRFRLVDAISGPVELMRQAGQRVAVTADADPWVHGRASDLRQIVQNLLENAHNYAWGTLANVTIGVDEASAVLRVSDLGRGVPAEEADTIFEWGVRGSASVGTDGTGLGLASARRLAREMGGDLGLVPSAQGAVFELRLPAAPAPAAHESGPGGADD